MILFKSNVLSQV